MAVVEPDIPVRRRRGKGMPTSEAHGKYPSLAALTQPSGKSSRGAWVAAFNARPDAMAALLADFIKQVHAKPGRIGQRPMPREEQVDFSALVYGDDNDLPLSEVLPKLIRGTERDFAIKVFMSKSQVHRLIAGDYEPDVHELRIIAAAVGKPALYFVEYRKAMAIAAFIHLVNERPGVATTLYKRYLEVRMGQE